MDTNVASELMRPYPEAAVEAWVGSQQPESLFFSTVSEAELLYGAAILPQGRRRDALFRNIEGTLRSAFGERVLPFDRGAARFYGTLAAMRRSAGLRKTPADCQIAAIARSRGMTVVTRNIIDFVDMELELVNPWQVP